METEKVLEELKDIMVERLKFEPSRHLGAHPGDSLAQGNGGIARTGLA